MTDQRPPPLPPPRVAPTLLSVTGLLEALIGQIRATRLDIDGLRSDVEEIRRHVGGETPFRLQPKAPTPAPTPAPARLPPIPPAVARAAPRVVRVVAYGVAALSVGSQALAAALPQERGPLVEALRVLLLTVGAKLGS